VKPVFADTFYELETEVKEGRIWIGTHAEYDRIAG
jgi:hypothetical protein